jgi:hypothetical protein
MNLGWCRRPGCGGDTAAASLCVIVTPASKYHACLILRISKVCPYIDRASARLSSSTSSMYMGTPAAAAAPAAASAAPAAAGPLPPVPIASVQLAPSVARQPSSSQGRQGLLPWQQHPGCPPGPQPGRRRAAACLQEACVCTATVCCSSRPAAPGRHLPPASPWSVQLHAAPAGSLLALAGMQEQWVTSGCRS